ncbi:MAG: sirohydrochlorin cobaltochelatase [Desulfoarculaceae bacterium]|nr:sirohydrochlorin cobaltochelatase [Desulfoarculaceae bacterium]
MNPTPIVIAAFGTTTKALASYDYLDARIRGHFPDHEILWAYSSRMVKDKVVGQQQMIANPHVVLDQLYRRHSPWAVVQSLHLLGGHEFSRLVAETDKSPIRTSIGLPLLSSPEDFLTFCTSLAPLIKAHPDEAILLVGHGTDHPAWCAYPALQYFMRRHFGPRIFVGVIEGSPASTEVIADITASGHKKVRIIPLLLVAGMHFHRDLTGGRPDSWTTLLSQADISVEIIGQGIGTLPAISDMFCRHIEDALAIIPDHKAPA